MPRFDAEELDDDLPPLEHPKRSRPVWLILGVVGALLLAGGVLLAAGLFTARRQVQRERDTALIARAEADEARFRAEQAGREPALMAVAAPNGPAAFDGRSADETARWLHAEVVRISNHDLVGIEFAQKTREELRQELEAAPVGEEVSWRLPVARIDRAGFVYLSSVRYPAAADPQSLTPVAHVRARGGFKWTGSVEQLRALKAGDVVTFRAKVVKVVREDRVVTVTTTPVQTRTESMFDFEPDASAVVGP